MSVTIPVLYSGAGDSYDTNYVREQKKIIRMLKMMMMKKHDDDDGDDDDGDEYEDECYDEEV